MKVRISFLRRVFQIVSFILIIWGGVLIFDGRKANLPSVFVVARAPNDFKQMVFTKNAPPYNQPYNLYLTFRSCRYARNTGLFRGCMYHFFQEILSWKDPLRVWGPYMLLILFLAILLGRFTCGWICPIGFLQEVLASIRKFFKIKRIKIGEKVSKKMRIAGIFMIVFVLILAYLAADKSLAWGIRDGIYLAGCQMCPSRIISSLLTGYPVLLDLWRPLFRIFFIICVIFLLFIIGSIFINRLWCRICPNGIVLSYFNKGKCLVKEKDLLKCTRCGVCANECSMEETKVYEEKSKEVIDHFNCVSCFKCVESCPEKALKVKFLGLRIF